MRRRWEETIGARPALLPTKANNAEPTQYQGDMPDVNDTTLEVRSQKARYTFGFSGTEADDGLRDR